jgi:DNA topoisomerase-1
MLSENQNSAREAGLRYIQFPAPGISRIRRGGDFVFLMPDGSEVKDEATLRRIRSLVIPPAWEEVWICLHENGHLQATGTDKRGRKQYKYHPQWSAHRSGNKFSRMQSFAAALPRIRSRVEKDLSSRGISQRKVLAAVVALMEKSHIRIGNREYALENKSYGLTTLRDRHAKISGSSIMLQFVGKKGVEHRVELSDRRLANIVRRCKEIPGYELFQYFDECGDRHSIGSGDVNRYLKEITNEDFTAKDFRTWAGSVHAYSILSELPPPQSEKESKHNIAAAIKLIARLLGNTPTVCRKYYVHPRLLEAYAAGTLNTGFRRCRKRGLTPEECALVKMLSVK